MLGLFCACTAISLRKMWDLGERDPTRRKQIFVFSNTDHTGPLTDSLQTRRKTVDLGP